MPKKCRDDDDDEDDMKMMMMMMTMMMMKMMMMKMMMMKMMRNWGLSNFTCIFVSSYFAYFYCIDTTPKGL